MVTGTLYNIQRFCIHDGPGIRTTVFLKGCPLSCRWCANPESQSPKPQLMKRDIKCSGCKACVAVCPQKAIQWEDGRRRISWERCDHCFRCVEACLYGALTIMGRRVTVAEVLDVARRDAVFYRNSGGGVTISGGEPLAQPGFLKKLLQSLKQEDLHVALDTTGFAQPETLAEILPLVDLVLLDIKHLDSRTHRQMTGVDNASILKNASRIAGKTPLWLRMPLIHPFNTGKEHALQMVDLARSLGAEKLSLLPYHEGGISKRAQIGMPPARLNGGTPKPEMLLMLEQIFRSRGVACDIGA